MARTSSRRSQTPPHLRILGGALMCLALLLGCAESDDSSDRSGSTSGPIKIGVILELTGEGASLGQPMMSAIELAAEQINEDGGIDGRDIELVVKDNQSAEDVSARLTIEAIGSDRVDLIIGPARSGNGLAMKSIAEESKIPMISLSANSQITEDATWVFKTVQNDSVIIANMVDYAAEQGWKTLSLIRDGSGFGEGVDELLETSAEDQGIELVDVQKFDPTATDFTAQLVNVRSADADATVMWGIPPTIALLQKAYVSLGLDAPVLQSHGVGNSVFLETAGAAANGIVAPLGRFLVADQVPADDPQRPVLEQFSQDYADFAGTAPSTFAGNAYDAMKIAALALQEAGTDPDELRAAIEGVSDYVGVTGIFNFTPENHTGLEVDAPAIVTVEDGQWKLLDNNRD